jgi:hypothetical protein
MVRVFYSILLAFVLLNPVHGQPTTPSGIEQLKQFVKTVRSAQGEFVQQQMRSPKANEPQDKQDIGGIDLQEILIRVLASTLGRHRSHRAFNQFE